MTWKKKMKRKFPMNNNQQTTETSVSTEKLQRMLELILIPTLFFTIIGSFHIHFMLTAGDWDFWLDWKDREWWITISPVMAITFCSALQFFFWKNFRLPIGATFAIMALLLGEWVVRISGFHLWSNYPINLVTPATFLAGALVLDAILLLTRSMLLTAIFGGSLFALTFFPSNWAWLAAYHVPIEFHGQVMTAADLIGFEYIRTGTPEYIRIIERGTLRTFGQHSVAVASFFSAFLCILVYAMWWFVGKAFATVAYIKERI